jgi:hypothetical protein
MRMSLHRLIVLSVSLALPATTLAGPTAPRIAPEAPSLITPVAVPQELPTAFQQGEDLKFVIKWGVVKGGYSTLKVQNTETIEGQPTYHVVAEAHSTGMVDTFYKVNDRNETWVQPQTRSSVKYSRKIQEGKYRLDEQVVLDQKEKKYHLSAYRHDKNKHINYDGDIPANVLDVLGSFYYVRTLPLEVGKTFTLDVHSGTQVYPLQVKVKKRQMVSVKAGKFDCFLVEPELRSPGIFIAKGKKLEVFLTADERRMPVLMRSEIFIGHVRAELVSHRTVTPSETYALTQADKADVDGETAE